MAAGRNRRVQRTCEGANAQAKPRCCCCCSCFAPVASLSSLHNCAWVKVPSVLSACYSACQRTCHALLPLAGAGLLHREEWLGIQPVKSYCPKFWSRKCKGIGKNTIFVYQTTEMKTEYKRLAQQTKRWGNSAPSTLVLICGTSRLGFTHHSRVVGRSNPGDGGSHQNKVGAAVQRHPAGLVGLRMPFCGRIFPPAAVVITS